MFVLLMTLKIDLEKEYITHDEFQNFIKGGAAVDLNTCAPKPAKWITDLTWMNLVELSKLRHFQYIIQQVTNNDKAWKAWFDKDAPEEAFMPEGYNSLDTFRKLLMIRCAVRTMQIFVSSTFKLKFSQSLVSRSYHHTKYEVYFIFHGRALR